jgi:hypothetical protein
MIKERAMTIKIRNKLSVVSSSFIVSITILSWGSLPGAPLQIRVSMKITSVVEGNIPTRLKRSPSSVALVPSRLPRFIALSPC